MDLKTFIVPGSKGNRYHVSFWEEDGNLKASCECKAGQYGSLCKHVLGLINSEPEIHEAFIKSYGDVYDAFIEKSAELEKVKKEVNARKHQLSRLLLD